MRSILLIVVTVFISAIGYGLSFPLLGARIEAAGATGLMIGLNAAMPALGWIAGSAVVPLLQLHFRIPIGVLAMAFLFLATAGIVGLQYAETFEAMTALRLVFGGGMGLFYRSVEYWINGLSENSVRARNLAMNGVALMLGLAIGSAIQPELGASGWIAFGPIVGLLAIAALGTRFWPHLTAPPQSTHDFAAMRQAMALLPLAYVGVLIYGLYESIPAYFNQIYALKHGLGEEIAAYALTAAALGNILVPIPVALVSDRYGRRGPLIACALLAAIASLSIPWTLASPAAFLGAILLAAGAAGSIYGLALAAIGDHFKGAELVVANATFGIVYSAASLIGPVFNGVSTDMIGQQGLPIVAAATFTTLFLAALIMVNRTRAPQLSVEE